MVNRRHESWKSDGAASRISKKAIIDFLLESDSDLSSISEESSDEEDQNDISIDSKTEEDNILDEHEDIDNIDNNNSIIDQETSEGPEASHQTVENSRNRPGNTSWSEQKKNKKLQVKYAGIKWQKEPPTDAMKRRLFTGVLSISAAVMTKNLTDSLNLWLLMNF